MARWIIDRLLQMIVVLICASLLGFLLVRLLKGNEIFALLGDNYTKQAAAQLNQGVEVDPAADPLVTPPLYAGRHVNQTRPPGDNGMLPPTTVAASWVEAINAR